MSFPRDAFLSSAHAVLDRASTLDLPSLNESNTKRLLIEPILAALGWNLFDVTSVYSEYRVYDGTFLDYALLVDSKAVLFCEAKPTGKRLDDPKWVSQTVNYANNEGVVWCVLTDGLRWRVFKANEAVSMDRKLAFEVSLAEVPDPLTQDRALRLFACLTPAAVADGQLTALGTQVFVDGRVRAALVDVLEQPDRRLVDLLRSRIGAEARLTPADIKAALSRVAAPALAALDKAAATSEQQLPSSPVSPVSLVPPQGPGRDVGLTRQDPQRTPSAPTSPEVRTSWADLPDVAAGEPATTGELAAIATLRAISGKQARNQLAAVVRAGLLEPEETVSLRYKGQISAARVRADGCLDVPGSPEPLALSRAAEVVIGHGSWNGWDHWYVERAGQRVLLTRLRQQLASTPG